VRTNHSSLRSLRRTKHALHSATPRGLFSNRILGPVRALSAVPLSFTSRSRAANCSHLSAYFSRKHRGRIFTTPPSF
jgi:hypothetical protein